jgi:NO-binding membrane sensor protein with MHYT domain
MRRWPPVIWLFSFVSSLLILNGADTTYRPELLIPGIALAVAGLVLALWVAYGRYDDRPPATGISWLLPATAGWYLLSAIAASTAGTEYALAALAAGMIPMTAAAILVASARSKTVRSGHRPVDVTGVNDDDPFPGIGVDDETPLGDTPEHSDAERVARPDPRLARRRNPRTR